MIERALGFKSHGLLYLRDEVRGRVFTECTHVDAKAQVQSPQLFREQSNTDNAPGLVVSVYRFASLVNQSCRTGDCSLSLNFRCHDES